METKEKKKIREDKVGITAISKVRQKMIDDGYTINHDRIMNYNGNLYQAARAILNEDNLYVLGEMSNETKDKILTLPVVERLALVGALIAAEIDRLELEGLTKMRSY